MLRSSRYAPELDQPPATRLRGPPSQPIAAVRRPILTAFWAFFDALRESLAAHREYEHLRSRGMPHDKALREALGIGLRPSGNTRCATKPLYCAGRA